MSRNLELLNSMKVVESSGSCGELEYVYVEATTENIDKIRQLGYNGELDIDGGVIDVSPFAFDLTGAQWFEESLGGFIDYVPDHAPEWAK